MGNPITIATTNHLDCPSSEFEEWKKPVSATWTSSQAHHRIASDRDLVDIAARFSSEKKERFSRSSFPRASGNWTPSFWHKGDKARGVRCGNRKQEVLSPAEVRPESVGKRKHFRASGTFHLVLCESVDNGNLGRGGR